MNNTYCITLQNASEMDMNVQVYSNSILVASKTLAKNSHQTFQYHQPLTGIKYDFGYIYVLSNIACKINEPCSQGCYVISGIGQVEGKCDLPCYAVNTSYNEPSVHMNESLGLTNSKFKRIY